MFRDGSSPGSPAPHGISPLGRRTLVAAAWVLLCLALSQNLGATEGTFFIVVHAGVSERDLEPTFVADAFLKKRTRWPNGEAIRPVDQRRDAPVRRYFSSSVLKRSVEAVRNYWQQRIFSGRDVPPPEADSDVSVLRYVQENAGAIGYVAEAPNVHGVRVITLK